MYFLYVAFGDFDILQTFSVYDFVLNIKMNFKLFVVFFQNEQTVYHG